MACNRKPHKKQLVHIGNVLIGIKGQSQASGLSQRSFLYKSKILPSLTRAFSRVLIYNPEHKKFEPLQIGKVNYKGQGGGNAINEVNTIYQGRIYEDGFGPDIGIAQRWEQETSEADTLRIIKFAKGGSQIVRWINDGDLEKAYEQYYHEAISLLKPGIKMKAMLFDHGEADAGDSMPEYFKKDSIFIVEQFQKYNPEILVQVLKRSPGVSAAQKKAYTIFQNVKYYDCRAYSTIDGTHYSGKDMLNSGGRDFFNLVFNTEGTIKGL